MSIRFCQKCGNMLTPTKNDSEIKDNVVTYISHGVKSSDWDGNRRNKLESFMNGCNNDNIRIGLVNLAAEMEKNAERRINNGKYKIFIPFLGSYCD